MAKPKINISRNGLDKLIEAVAPQWGARRYKARMAMALAGAYTGASKRRRSMSEWDTSTGDADTDLLPDLALLRERSRDLVRNNPLAVGALNTKCTNIVGTGLRVQSQIDADYLGLTAEQAGTWQSAAEREFRLWGNSREADLERTLNFAQLQELALRSCFESGDVFSGLPMVARPGSVYETRVQVIEGDRVSNPNWAADTVTLAGGIERDENGAPVRAHITKQHPGKLWGRSGQGFEWQPYDFFDQNGWPLLLHVFAKRRPGQSRGIPDLAPVIESLKQLGTYTEAELMAAVISGMFTVFIKSETGDALGSTTMQPTSETGGRASDKDFKLGNGAIIELANDESIETANPGRPNAQFDPFVLAVLRQVGVALELPYELVIKHFTASYSASRAALLEAWRMFKSRRKWFADVFCQPIYEMVITEAVLIGRLDAPGFLFDPTVRAAYLGATWTGDAPGQLDPQKETEAARNRVEYGFSTHARESAEMNGSDFEQNTSTRKREYRMLEEAGLPRIGFDNQPVQSAPPTPAEDDEGGGDGGGPPPRTSS